MEQTRGEAAQTSCAGRGYFYEEWLSRRYLIWPLHFSLHSEYIPATQTLAPDGSQPKGRRCWTLIQFLRCRAHPTTRWLATLKCTDATVQGMILPNRAVHPWARPPEQIEHPAERSRRLKNNFTGRSSL